MKKVAILTNMMDFNSGYSLTGIIKDQTEMLVRYGHEVHLYVNEQFNQNDLPDFKHVTVHQKMPFSHLIDYTTINALSDDHKETRKKTCEMLTKELADCSIVFTHDFVFTGWFMPYGMGCIDAAKNLPDTRFMHWVHSVPSTSRDWWEILKWGKKHKIIFPNPSDRIRVIEQFRGTPDDIRIIPHIKDIRTWGDFHSDTRKLIDLMPSVLSSKVMQVLPAGTDRLSAKGLEIVIKIFGYLKTFNVDVCLLIANQWASGRERKDCIEPYEKIAKNAGLEPMKDFAFTSDLHEDWANGIPKHMVRELFQCSNLFVFPTREESFGLVVPESVLSSCVLPVLNKSLECQLAISGFTALYFEFGSFSNNLTIHNPENYFRDIAQIILGRMEYNEAIKMKTFFKNMNNMDYLYHKYYAPIMQEATLWGN